MVLNEITIIWDPTYVVFNINGMGLLVFKGLNPSPVFGLWVNDWLRWEVSKELAGWKGIHLPSDSEPRTAWKKQLLGIFQPSDFGSWVAVLAIFWNEATECPVSFGRKMLSQCAINWIHLDIIKSIYTTVVWRASLPAMDFYVCGNRNFPVRACDFTCSLGLGPKRKRRRE